MSWTYADIAAKVREITGRLSVNQLSSTALLADVNEYYRDIFPVEVLPPELKGWYTFNTSDGVGTQALPSTVFSVKAPVYINNDDARLWTDIGRFHQEYPHDYTTKDVPTDMLLFGRTLYIRKIPNSTYEVRLNCVKYPVAIKDDLTELAAFANNTDVPQNTLWGPAIAYGTAIEILKANGEHDEADALSPMYGFYKSKIKTSIYLNRPRGQRPRPRF